MRPVFMETGHDLVLPRFFDTGIQLEDSTQWICLIGIDSRLLEGYQCTRRLTNTSDHTRSSRTIPTDMEVSQMSSSALVPVKRQLTAFSIVNDRIPTLQISSDVTLEEIEFRSADIEYTGYLAGPGPALACQSRLRVMGLSDTAITEFYQSRIIPRLVGPFTDIYPVSSKHPWLWHEILMLVRLITIIRPTIIRSEGPNHHNYF